MKNKNLVWKILLIIGLIPFFIVIGYGMYASINGFSALCVLNCTKEYGFIAFRDSVLLYSYVFWPTYIIGLILITLSVIKLRNNITNVK